MEVRVEYDYTAEERDELTLKQGDIIENVSQFEEGWFIGTLNGKEGVFPDNFVKVIKESKSGEKSGNGSPIANNDFPSQPKASNGQERSPVRPKSQNENRKSPGNTLNINLDELSACEWVRVTFQYSPEQSDELELSVNDIIQVLDRNLPEEGWWRGHNVMTKRIGVFPDNFVKVISCNDPDLKQALIDNNFTSLPKGVRPGNSHLPNNGFSGRPLESSTTPVRTHSTPLPETTINKSKFDPNPKLSTAKKADTIENPTGHCLTAITTDRPRQPGKRLPTKITTNISSLPCRNESNKPMSTKQDSNTRQSQLPKSANCFSNTPLSRRNSMPKSESDVNNRNLGRSRAASTSRSDSARSNDLSSKQLVDLQQVINEQQEQLQAFAAQLNQFASTLAMIQKNSREGAESMNHQFSHFSKKLDALKDAQTKTHTEMTTNQQALVERIQALTLEVDEVQKTRSANAVELNRIKKIVMNLESRAMTSSMSGCGEMASPRYTSPREMIEDTGIGKVYMDPLANVHNR